MQQSVLEMTKDLVEAQIRAGQLTPDDTQTALRDTYASLMALQTQAAGVETGQGSVADRPSGPIDWRKSITQHAITCLECGAVYKQLSIRHLREHDLNARSYRAKYGIPPTVSLAARATTARRRRAVQAIRPWEKSPRYQQAHAGTAAAAKQKAVVKRDRKTRAR